MTERRVCEVHRLGILDFTAARKLQSEMALEIAVGNRPATLLLLEHPHTYTFGRLGKEQNLLWNDREIAENGVEVHWTDRGGDATYHGPGQLVGYPLIQLGRLSGNTKVPKGDFVQYLRDLEDMLIRAMASIGLPTGQRKGQTGVWVQPDVASRCKHCPPAARKHPSKMASIGVRITAEGVSQHGFALNVDPDMRYWEGIVACDLPDAPMVSLADLLDPAPDMDSVVSAVVQEFGKVFGLDMVEAVEA